MINIVKCVGMSPFVVSIYKLIWKEERSFCVHSVADALCLTGMSYHSIRPDSMILVKQSRRFGFG